MSTPLPDGGATVLPPHAIEDSDSDPCIVEGIKYKHSEEWVWINGVWTDKVKCIVCGRERVPTR